MSARLRSYDAVVHAADGWVDKVVSAFTSNRNVDADVAKDWNRRAERLAWGRYGLSVGVVVAIVALAWKGVLEPQMVLTLLLAVVGSLFVSP